jgi:hypothetical protein
MKQYKILYWDRINDNKDSYEDIVEANKIDDALIIFRNKKPFAIIEGINLVL